jgi:hypothetical protein
VHTHTHTHTHKHTLIPTANSLRQMLSILPPDAWYQGRINIWVDNSSLPDAMCPFPPSLHILITNWSFLIAPWRLYGPSSPWLTKVQKPIGHVTQNNYFMRWVLHTKSYLQFLFLWRCLLLGLMSFNINSPLHRSNGYFSHRFNL